MSRVAQSRPTMAPSSNGFATSSPGGGAYGANPSRRGPYPHIDDLTSVTVDLDPYTPLRKVLEIGNAHMGSATAFNDFRRPDLALPEFIKAFTIAVEKIPKHKDYPSLKSDRGDLGRLYNALKSKIANNAATFERIKEDIKEDNRRSGVRPRAETSPPHLPPVPSNPSSPGRGGGANGIVNGGVRTSTETSTGTDATGGSRVPTPKSRPIVHPKPQALSGNALKPGAKSPPQDLASRFARLRVASQEAVNDTVASAPSTRPATADENFLPSMPKMPDAIYSPARGTVTSEVADLPSSTPRGLFSRTNSIASTSHPSARNSVELGSRSPAIEHHVTPRNFSNSTPLAPISSARVHIPEGETMTPQELREFMRQGSNAVRILLIDVRGREDFDDGHILSQETICVDPSVLNRENVSASDIADSLGIAPDEEMQAFEHRAEYDLVVYYNQDTNTLPLRPSTDTQETAMWALFQALVHFNYGHELKHPPKLLAGGVDAWVDLFGPRSLKETDKTHRINGFASTRYNRRRARTQTKTLKPEEIKLFEESIMEDEKAARSPHKFYRSTEEFFRQPVQHEARESMTSVEGPRVHKRFQPSFDVQLPPAPPARPAPALPRTSYSGLSSRDSATEVVYTKAPRAADSETIQLRTGLENPSNWCYANSIIQSLLASPGFVTELKREQWPGNWKSKEAQAAPPSQHPQLMSKILGSLIQWLSKKEFEVMKATTFMRYCNSIHKGDDYGRFGDHGQHDAQEFLIFIFQQLELETNRSHTKAEPLSQKETERLDKLRGRELAIEAWKLSTATDSSVIHQYWNWTSVISRTCNNCQHTQDAMDHGNTMLSVSTLPDRDLQEVIKQDFNSNSMHQIEDYSCPAKCRGEHEVGNGNVKRPVYTKATQSMRLARLPPLLCIHLKRFTMDDRSNTRKTTHRVRIPLDGLDLTDLSLPRDPSHPPGVEALDDGFDSSCVYDLYAVVSHQGATAGGGHYISYVRVGRNEWVKCSDTRLSREDNKGGRLERELEGNEGGMTPYLLFYMRRDKKWPLPWGVKG